MGKEWKSAGMTESDVLLLLKQIEDDYAIKVRITIVPRPGSGYKQGCIVLVTPYDRSGRKMADIQAEQHLYPSSGHKSLVALEVYLLHRLIGVIDEHEHQAAREAQATEPERMTPLEQYIAKSF
jgi:hypothetical protein